MATKRKQQQIDAMVKRLQDLSYQEFGDCWGSEEFPLTIESFNAVANNIRYRFEIPMEPDSQLWHLFHSTGWLHEWATPERIAEYLIDNGIKP